MSAFYHVLKLSLLGFLVGIAGLLISFFQSTHELEEDTGLGLLFKLRGPRRAPRDAVVVASTRSRPINWASRRILKSGRARCTLASSRF